MFALVLLGVLAGSSAAAGYDPYDYNNGFQGSMNSFWENFNRQMNDLGKKIENDVKHSINQAMTSKIEGDEYKMTIYLTGFNKEDIHVTANKGNLVIRAIHNVPGEQAYNYLYVSNLPDFVDEENGSWYYNNGILTIIFPITQLESNGSRLLYVNNENDETSENKDPEEDDIRDNSYDTDKLKTTADENQYDNEAIQSPEDDVEND